MTYSYGSSGAPVDRSVSGGRAWDLRIQIDQSFRPYHREGRTFDMDTSLFIFWFGINDVNRGYRNWSPGKTKRSFDSYERRISNLYRSGARNFLFINVPPIDRSPTTRLRDNSAALIPRQRSMIKEWNSNLLKLVNSLKKKHRDTTVIHFDSHSLFNQVMNRPRQFRETALYQDTRTACMPYKW